MTAPRSRGGEASVTEVAVATPRSQEHRKAAARAGLRYVTDGAAGITRRRAGSGWTYFEPDGTRIRDLDKRQRLNSLAIPPAWTDVWICPVPTATSRPPAATRAAASSIATTPDWRDARDAIQVPSA